MKKAIVFIMLFIVEFFYPQNKMNQNRPCLMESEICWQLYAYRDNENNTEDSRPNFEYTGRGFMNLRLTFKEGREEGMGIIKGHSLASSFLGGITWTEDQIKIKQLAVFPMNEYSWGLDSLEAVLRNCSSYFCQGDSLYINYYNDNRTAVFFKVGKLQSSE